IVMAVDKNSGKELWRRLDGAGGYAPPMIYEAGGRRQLIVWHPSAVSSLEPESGKVLWSHPFRVKMNIAIATRRLDGDGLFVTAFYSGPLMLKLAADRPATTLLWRGKSSSEQSRLTDGLHCLMSTPVILDGHIYGVCSYGQLRCLQAGTGQRLWETFTATGGEEGRWGDAFPVPPIPSDGPPREGGRGLFVFNEKGDLLIARLTPQGYDQVDRAHILEPQTATPAAPWYGPTPRSRIAACTRGMIRRSSASTSRHDDCRLSLDRRRCWTAALFRRFFFSFPSFCQRFDKQNQSGGKAPQSKRRAFAQ